MVFGRRRRRGHAGPPRSASRPRTIPTSTSSSTTSPTRSSRSSLPVQLEAGHGPDIARVTNLKALAQHWLDLRPLPQGRRLLGRRISATTLDWMRPDGSNAIPGFMTQLTLTGGFANKTLFEQAGRAAARRQGDLGRLGRRPPRKVAAEPEDPDRLGVRPLRPPHLRAGDLLRRQLHRRRRQARRDRRRLQGHGRSASSTGTRTAPMPKEVWGGVAGTTYRAPTTTSSTPRSPSTISGSLADRALRPRSATTSTGAAGPALRPRRLLRHARRRGAGRDQVHQEPRGRGQGDGLPGKRAGREGVLRAHPVPAGPQGRGRQGRRLQDRRSERQARARRSSSTATQSASPLALKMPGWKWSGAIYGALVTRVSQVVAGEMTLRRRLRAHRGRHQAAMAAAKSRARSRGRSRIADGADPSTKAAARNAPAAVSCSLRAGPALHAARSSCRCALAAEADRHRRHGGVLPRAEHADLRHLRAGADRHQLRSIR